MPPTTSKSASKRKAPAFKPPHPSKSTSTNTKTTAPRRKSAPAKSKRPSFIADEASASEDEDDEEEEEDDDDIIPSIETPQDDESSDLEALPRSTQGPSPTIPPALLTKLLHHHFQDESMRIGKEANGVVGKYMETFVREAIARAAFERSEAEGGEGRGGWQGGFLEVSDFDFRLWEEGR